jgi:hypothetical protein
VSFSAQVKYFATINDANKFRKGVSIALFKAVILDTPVLTGRLRGNWQASFSNPASGTLETSDKTGSETVIKSSVFVNNTPMDGSVFLTNNLPYAARIEYDGWSKTKAPEGMVRRNLVRISSLLKNKLK